MEKIAIIGLGYVGLPLAHVFSFKYPVVGFDISRDRIEDLKKGYDKTLELSENQVKECLDNGMKFSDNLDDISDCNIYIVTVPTPLDKYKNPDLTPLIKASESVGKVLKKGDIVIYESTVYPGATEEECVPVLERVSGLKFNEDFFAGYSPERINPGDKEHTVTKILKVTSGSTPEIAKKVDDLYKSIIIAGTHKASSIKVAEAAKVIENSQRDINIAFVNELALIFDKLGIDTNDVLEAAGTKWNFLRFKPGLVGGHCQAGNEYVVLKDNDKIEVTTFEELNKKIEIKKEMNFGVTNFKFPKRNYQVLSFNPLKGNVFENVNVFTKRDYNKMIKIKTSLGNLLEVSDKHPMIVKENNQYNVKLADELKIGDEIPVISKLPTIFRNQVINLIDILKNSNLSIRVKLKNNSWKNYKEFISKKYLNVKVSNFLNGDYLPFDKYLLIREKLNLNENNLLLITGRGPSYSEIPVVFEVDKNFARFIGYYLSEGCLTKDKSIRTRITINKDEKQFQQDIENILQNWGIKYSIYDDRNFNSRTIKISNNLFGEMLKFLEVGKDSYDAKIPDIILFNEDKIKFEVLRGLFIGDGGFSYPTKISYFTSSNKMFQQIILLLQHFDIIPFIQKRDGLLEIYSKDDLIKCKELFLDDKKEKLLNAIENKKTSFNSKNYYKQDGFFIVKIKEIEIINKSTTIYSMEVANTHNYITTGGVMTHNCIGIDPYYLAHKAKEIGYHPEIILAGRRTNDNMGMFVANKVVKLMIQKGHTIKNSKVLVLGITFKENCPDIRNSRVIDVIRELEDFGINVDIYDPWADNEEVKREYDLELKENYKLDDYDAIILAVAHNEFKNLNITKKDNQVIYDIKGFLDKNLVDGRL